MRPRHKQELVQFSDPDLEERLLQRIRTFDLKYEQLTADEVSYLRQHDVRSVCPVCDEEFSVLDRDHKRFRKHCSLVCSNQSKAKRPLKWSCILCARRFRHSKALQKHLAMAHPECDEHEYVRRYFTLRGRDTSQLRRFCGSCKRELKLNFGRVRYAECHCIHAERKLFRIQEALRAETDGVTRTHYQHQIKGLKGTITRLRRTTLPTAQVNMRIASSEAPGLAREVISCDWMDGLISQGQECASIRDRSNSVYLAYYHLLGLFAAVPSLDNAAVITANQELLQTLKDSGWTSVMGDMESSFLFVWALDGSNPQSPWQEYRLRTDYPVASYRKLREHLKIDEAGLKEFLAANRSLFPYPLDPEMDPRRQCWHRIVIPDNGQSVHRLNPGILLELYRATHAAL